MPCIELTTCRMCNLWNVAASCFGPELQNLKLYIRHRLWNLQTKTASWCSYSQNSCVFLFGPLIWLIQLYFLCDHQRATITICCSQQYFDYQNTAGNNNNLTEYRFFPLICTNLMKTWRVLLYTKENVLLHYCWLNCICMQLLCFL